MRRKLFNVFIGLLVICALLILVQARDNSYFSDDGYLRVPLEISLPSAVKTALINHPSIIDIIDNHERSIVILNCQSQNCDSKTEKVHIIEQSIISECRVNYLSDGSVRFARVTIRDGVVDIDSTNNAHTLCVEELLG